jgi:hypothetical protein
MNKTLKFKIEAQNAVNAALLAHVPKMLAALALAPRPVKVKLTTGEMSKQLRKILPETVSLQTKNLRVWYNYQHSSLWASFSANAGDDTGTFYAEGSAYLGEILNDFTLGKVNIEWTGDSLKKVWTVEEVERAQKKIDFLSSLLNKAENALPNVLR